jgi:phosphonate ABC transporter binding protein
MINRRIVLAGAAALAFTASASAEDWKAKYPEITFAVVPAENASGVTERYAAFVSYLSKELGIKVNLRVANDYAAVIEGQRAGNIHIASYGSASFARARLTGVKTDAFANDINADGSTGYYSMFFVKASGSYKTIDDVKGKNLGLVDPNSTSGFLVPTAYIFAAKSIDPKSCFKTVRNANHQANAMAVANKQVAAATNNSEDLQRVAASAPDARSQIKIIWTSPLIPLDPLVWRKDLDPAVKTKLYTFLLSYGRIGIYEMALLDVVNSVSESLEELATILSIFSAL